MTKGERESLLFYKYLCHKIGAEEDIRTRRLGFISCDIHNHPHKCNALKLFPQISSGSKAEGLNLSGSDVDIMLIDIRFEVYESEYEAVQGQKVVLIIDTEDTPPCFSRLLLCTDFRSVADEKGKFKRFLHFEGSKVLLSSELYKLHHLNIVTQSGSSFNKIHGPCISDDKDHFDFAYSLKCNKWISQAQPWIHRSRTKWPNADSIEKIIKCGILFVPIGCKDSTTENLQWRMSFSVAEKILIFSFNHTQLLCYALLKIFLKEIIEKQEDLKGVLCSYFLKTLMFWISEEHDLSIWTPDNMITCFKVCLRKLLYCIENSTLLHFFIPDNNLFYLRFNDKNKATLIKLLKNAYCQDISCFSPSTTLNDYQNFSSTTFDGFVSIVPEIMKIFSSGIVSYSRGNISSLMKFLLFHSRSFLSRNVFALFLSNANNCESQHSRFYKKRNKLQYFEYRRMSSQLLISVNSDAVSGWLALAAFFYKHEKYTASILLLEYALSKCTDDKIEAPTLNAVWLGFDRNQQLMLNLTKHESLITVLKAFTIRELRFCENSQLIPTELTGVKLNRMNNDLTIHPKPFAHFLSFLCYYHLRDLTSCRHSMYQLDQIVKNGKHFQSYRFGNFVQHKFYQDNRHLSFLDIYYTTQFLGIAHQMMGESEMARQYFQKFDNIISI